MPSRHWQSTNLGRMGRIRTLVGDIAYDLYGHRLTSSLPQDQLPAHVGVILDGNRRWAAEMGSSSAHGHRAGGEKITEFLGWCEELGVEVVTLWLLSTDNLLREPTELDALLEIIEDTVTSLGDTGRWQIHPVGALELLPQKTRDLLTATKTATKAVTKEKPPVKVKEASKAKVPSKTKDMPKKAEVPLKTASAPKEAAKKVSKVQVPAPVSAPVNQVIKSKK